MSTTIHTDMKVYNEQFLSAMFETIAQRIQAFSDLTGTVLNFSSEPMKGYYEQIGFTDLISGLIRRRVIGSTSTVSAQKLTQDEEIHVKIDRGIGPVEWTMDSLRKSGMTPEAAAFVLGQQAGAQKIQDYLNVAASALVGALAAQADNYYDATGVSGESTASPKVLTRGLQLFGDQAESIIAWLVPSGVSFDLLREAIDRNVDTIAGQAVYRANIGTLNRPMIVSDCPALIDQSTGGPNFYRILGLTAGAFTVKETEQAPLVTDIVTGYDNLTNRWQSEYAYNLGLKGFAWNTGTGVSPTDAAIATGSNWVKKMAAASNLAGVCLKVSAA